ncbi:hypothetical protein SAMN04244573_03194 [Azotobacter beijerinckii]|uniref:Uncharacterized protein n=1 Tax=Azotobacter beijerinckii TaxID=170623 RepID=A0A1H9MMM9_9GAMM|nr:hypothetical protein [Azotobacter beijerinckii]SER24966.1 hypothetical protein SAMN04244573_03194 [Azotobacter beijerinckii]
MIDPHDTQTLDLVQAARRPLTSAERQRRHREKKKREREEGRRVDMEFTSDELTLLRYLAGKESQYCNEWHPGSQNERAYTSLWRRLSVASVGHDYPGDVRWSREALEQDAAEVRCFLERQRLEVKGLRARVEQLEQENSKLVAERGSPLGGGGDLQDAEGLREFRLSDSDLAFLLWCIDDHMTIRNDLEHLYVPSVRDLIDRLFKDSRFSVCIETMGNDQGIQNILKRHKDEASRAHRNYQEEFKARSRDGERYTQSLRSLERENSMVVAERTQAFEAVAVLQQRLREAGLSDDYRA